MDFWSDFFEMDLLFFFFFFQNFSLSMFGALDGRFVCVQVVGGDI